MNERTRRRHSEKGEKREEREKRERRERREERREEESGKKREIERVTLSFVLSFFRFISQFVPLSICLSFYLPRR
mgnify:CR=1 FL=1